MSNEKSKVKLFFRSFLAIMLLVSIPCIALAQDDTPGDGCDPYPSEDGTGCTVPLDTWVMLLAIIAVAYGIYRLHKKQKALSV